MSRNGRSLDDTRTTNTAVNDVLAVTATLAADHGLDEDDLLKACLSRLRQRRAGDKESSADGGTAFRCNTCSTEHSDHADAITCCADGRWVDESQ